MTSFYQKLSNPLGLAVLDTVDYYSEGYLMYIITRINVPAEHRGKGIGNNLLSCCIQWANALQVDLFLKINASGPMDYDQLQSWYERKGFEQIGTSGIFRKRWST